MVIPVKISLIEEPQVVAFGDGTQHRKQDVWLRYENTEADGTQETWGTFMTLWDERIDEFVENLHPRQDDYIMVELRPSYKRSDWQGRVIYRRDLQVRPVLLPEENEKPL